jgi:hypothetical protein
MASVPIPGGSLQHVRIMENRDDREGLELRTDAALSLKQARLAARSGVARCTTTLSRTPAENASCGATTPTLRTLDGRRRCASAALRWGATAPRGTRDALRRICKSARTPHNLSRQLKGCRIGARRPRGVLRPQSPLRELPWTPRTSAEWRFGGADPTGRNRGDSAPHPAEVRTKDLSANVARSGPTHRAPMRLHTTAQRTCPGAREIQGDGAVAVLQMRAMRLEPREI